ncbi:MAG: GNAT family N-acetyltransferase [Spirochaetales bacterium]|nr:GNAT family N-acetyltransferase [Spirochaetales bacterium]
MELLDNIFKTEDIYLQLTSHKTQYPNYSIYRDFTTPELPLQNYTYINRFTSELDIRKIIQTERKRMEVESLEFLRFVFDPYLPNAGELPELSDFDFTCHYILIFKMAKIEPFYANKYCQLANEYEKDKLEKLLLKLNKDMWDVCTKHTNRWIDLKLNTKNIDTVVYATKGEYKGNCEIFYNNQIGKLEDFEVLEEFRDHGYGEALFNSAISIAKSNNVDYLYLIADRNDWVVDYYLKKGATLFAEYNSATLYR